MVEEKDIPTEEVSLDDLAQQITAAIGTYEWRGDDSMDTYKKSNKIGAIGRYQYMPATLVEDSKKYLGRVVTADEFKNNPQLQDQLAYQRTLNNLRNNYTRYGDLDKAVRMTAIDHYGHNGNAGYDSPAQHKGQVVGESPNAYADSVISILNNGGYSPSNPSSGDPFWDYAEGKKKPQAQVDTAKSTGDPFWDYAEGKKSNKKVASAKAGAVLPMVGALGLVDKPIPTKQNIEENKKRTEGMAMFKLDTRTKEQKDAEAVAALFSSNKGKKKKLATEAIKSGQLTAGEDIVPTGDERGAVDAPSTVEERRKTYALRGKEAQSRASSTPILDLVEGELYNLAGSEGVLPQVRAFVAETGQAALDALREPVEAAEKAALLGGAAAISSGVPSAIPSAIQTIQEYEASPRASEVERITTGNQTTDVMANVLGSTGAAIKVLEPFVAAAEALPVSEGIRSAIGFAAPTALQGAVNVAEGKQNVSDALASTVGSATLGALMPATRGIGGGQGALAQGAGSLLIGQAEKSFGGRPSDITTEDIINSGVFGYFGYKSGKSAKPYTAKDLEVHTERAKNLENEISQEFTRAQSLPEGTQESKDAYSRVTELYKEKEKLNETIIEAKDALGIKEEEPVKEATPEENVTQPVAQETPRANDTPMGDEGRTEVKAVAEEPTVTDKVVSAAVKVDGDVFEGATHGEAIDNAIKAGKLTRDADNNLVKPNGDDLGTFDSIDLFKTKSGKLVDRYEANAQFGISAAEMINPERSKTEDAVNEGVVMADRGVEREGDNVVMGENGKDRNVIPQEQGTSAEASSGDSNADVRQAPVAEEAVANYGKPSKSTAPTETAPPEPTEPQSAPNEPAPEFPRGAKVYTVDTATDANGNTISIGRPIGGRVVERTVYVGEDGRKYLTKPKAPTVERRENVIKVEGGKGYRFIDKNTLESGTPHPLTQKMVGESGASDIFIDRLTNAIGKNYGLTKSLFRAVGKGAQRMGFFRATVGEGEATPKVEIGMAKEIFHDPNLKKAVVAHEIGHLIDYIGDAIRNVGDTLKRGNLIGHFAALKEFKDTTLGQMNEGELRKELQAFGEAWNPMPAGVSKELRSYRNKPEELYADFFSGMINNPEMVKQIAPKAYDAFHANLENRPTVADAYNSLRDMSKGGSTAAYREKYNESVEKSDSGDVLLGQNVKKGDAGSASLNWFDKNVASKFNSNVALYKAHIATNSKADKVLKANGLKWKDYNDYWQYVAKPNPAPKDVQTSFKKQYSEKQLSALKEVYDIKGGNDLATVPILIARQLEVAPDVQIAMVNALRRDILNPLEDVGITQRQMDKYLEFTAIVGRHRAGLANPNDITPEIAQGMLDNVIKKDLGEVRYALLENKMQQFRDVVFNKMQEAHEAGLINDDTWAQIERNKDSYARFGSAKYFSDRLPFTFKEAQGSFEGETVNKIVGTMQTVLAADSKIRMNNAAKYIVDQFVPSNERRLLAENEKPSKGWGEVTVIRDGKKERWEVDRFFQRMFEYDRVHLEERLKAIEGIKDFQRGMLITYNFPFNVRNFFRDYHAGLTMLGYKYIGKPGASWGESKALASGSPKDLGRLAVETGTVKADGESLLYDRQGGAGKQLLAETGISAEGKPKSQKTGRVRRSHGFIQSAISVPENAPKLSTFGKAIKRGSSVEEASYIASLVGTPETRVRGSATELFNTPFLFFNTNLQGTLRAARMVRNPQTRTGYATRQIMYGIVPKLAQWALRYGWVTGVAKSIFGDDSDQAKFFDNAEKLYARSSNDLNRRYLAFPIPDMGATDRYGKASARMLTIPQDETSYMISSMVDAVLRNTTTKDGKIADIPVELGQNVSSTLPGYNPILNATLGVIDYLRTGQTYDSFRQRDVLTRNEENIARANRFDFKSDVPAKIGTWALESMLGSWYGLGESLVGLSQGEKIEMSRALATGLYQNTAAGTYEKLNKAFIEGQASDSKASIAVTKAKKSGNPSEIQKLQDEGVISEKRSKQAQKEMELTPEEAALRKRSMEDLEAQKSVYEEAGDTEGVQTIQSEIDRRNSKPKKRSKR